MARAIVTSADQASYLARKGSLEEKREFAKKIGSNFRLAGATLLFSYNLPYNFLAQKLKYEKWGPDLQKNEFSLDLKACNFFSPRRRRDTQQSPRKRRTLPSNRQRCILCRGASTGGGAPVVPIRRGALHAVRQRTAWEWRAPTHAPPSRRRRDTRAIPISAG